MNTTFTARLIAATLAAVTTLSLLLGMVRLGQPSGDNTDTTLAQQPQPSPVVVASTEHR